MIHISIIRKLIIPWYVRSTAVYTAVPWYGCPDLARKHDSLEFFLRKYWGTIDKNGMLMTWLASSGSAPHENFQPKKPLETFHDRQFTNRLIIYEPLITKHSDTLIRRLCPTRFLVLSDFLSRSSIPRGTEENPPNDKVRSDVLCLAL